VWLIKGRNPIQSNPTRPVYSVLTKVTKTITNQISGSAVQCSVKMEKRTVYAWGVAILCFVVLMIVTPAIPQSQAYHDFADKREFFGQYFSLLFFIRVSLSSSILIFCF
jgi:hypothetical protein